MRLNELVCPEPTCPAGEYMLFDASFILEREFEGLYFVCSVSPEGDLHVEGMPADAQYLARFNMSEHLAEAQSMVEDYMRGVGTGSFLVCPHCKEPLE